MDSVSINMFFFFDVELWLWGIYNLYGNDYFYAILWYPRDNFTGDLLYTVVVVVAQIHDKL